VSRVAALAGALGGTALLGAGIAPFLHQEESPDTWFAVQWPREVDPEAVVALLRHLSASRRPSVVGFEVSGARGQLSYRVGVARHDAQRLVHLFTSFIPGALLESRGTDGAGRFDNGRVVELRLGTRQRALRTDAAIEVSRSLATALTHESSEASVQWLVGPRLAPRHVTSDAASNQTVGAWLRSAALGTDERLDARARTELRDKVGDHGFRATCLVATTASEPRVAKAVLGRVVGAMRVAEGAGAHLRVRPGKRGAVVPPRRWPMVINVGELAGMLGWPLGESNYPGVTRIASRRLPISTAVPRGGRVLGDGTDPSTRRPLAQHARDALTHTLLLGPTGTGKSTLIASLAIQDIAAGRGVVVVDPKSDLIDEILSRIPSDRTDDVVVLRPDDEHPIGLNPLAHAGTSRELVVDQLMAVFRGLYGDLLGPRTSDILHSGLRAIAASSQPTLCALPLLLTDEDYRNQLAREATDAFGLQPFFDWFSKLSIAEASAVVAPALNKLRPLIARPALRAMLGQVAPRFDMREVFTKRKVLLVSLGSGVIGPEAAQLLGSLVVSQLWFAAQERTGIAPQKRHPVIAYLDEWHQLLHTPVDLGDLLAQSRAMGLGLVLANQDLHQLPPQVRSAALANARSKVCFRLSAEDASILARTTELLDAQDFQSLGRYEVYASLLADGHPTPYASALTRALPPETNSPDILRTRSRERFGVPAADVDAALLAITGQAEGKAAGSAVIGRRKRGST
jgi:hypothetical protein